MEILGLVNFVFGIVFYLLASVVLVKHLILPPK